MQCFSWLVMNFIFFFSKCSNFRKNCNKWHFFENISCNPVVVAIQAAQAAIPLSLVVAVDANKVKPGDAVEKDKYEGSIQKIEVTIHKDTGK